jgi:exodeoxyribonuclease VII small subunit
MTYSEAFAALQKLVEELEDDKIELDSLAEKVKQANELIKFCETKLRRIEMDVTIRENEMEKK